MPVAAVEGVLAAQRLRAWNHEFMGDVRIGSRGDSLVLRQDDSVDTITIALESDRLSATTHARDHYDLRGLIEFIADLADGAPGGWEGAPAWESIEGDIRLEAACNAGHVTITAQLRDERPDPANSGWTARLAITVDPGEELRQIASDAWHLLAPNTPEFTPKVIALLAEVVACGGEASYSRLFEHCHLTRPQLERQLNWMEKQDLVNQTHDTRGRVVSVRATLAGRDALQRDTGR